MEHFENYRDLGLRSFECTAVKEHMNDSREVLKQKMGSNIRTAREARNIGLREMSRLLDHKSPSSLSDIETGKKLADLDTIFKICMILRVELDLIIPDPQEIMLYRAKKLKIPNDYLPKDKLIQFKNRVYEENF